MIKICSHIIALYIILFLLSIFSIYLYISFMLIEQATWIFPNIKDFNSVIIVLDIIFFIFLYFLLKKREKYIIIATWFYFILFIMSIITFYFGYFQKDIFELVDISDEKFITKYQNIEIKDEENIYTYLFNLKNPDYKSNTLFWKYKDKLDKIQTNENYNKELIESEKIQNCYILNKYLELCNGLSINEYLKDKNYPNLLEQTKTFTNILQIINKNNVYKTNKNENSHLQYLTQQMRSNFYYLLINNKNNDKKEIIKYFQEHYNLFWNILNWDINLIEMLVFNTSLGILNQQLQYFLSNSDFSQEEKEILFNFLSKIYDNINEKEIYSNLFKNEYHITKSAINKGVILWVGNLDLAPKNFLYNYDKTIKILKNIYYFSYINKDLNKSEIIKNAFSKENRLSNNFRYNIFWNIQVTIGYSTFDWYFEDLETVKNDLWKIIQTFKK